jgi:hypothetical protein
MPKLTRFEALAPADVRPSTWARLRELVSPPGDCLAHGAQRFPDLLHRAYLEGQPELPAAPELAELGHDLLSRENELEVRRLGCVWLTMFPSLETVGAMRTIALDASEPLSLRDQAAWTLGFRQLQTRHESLFWAPGVVRAADGALLEAFHALRGSGRDVFVACRHVASPELLDALAEDPVGSSRAIEAFATEKLARAALARLAELPSEDAPRIVRLVAATLGEEAVPALLAHAASAGLPDKVEALYAALALDARRARPQVDAFLGELVLPGDLRARADWHEAHPGAFPLVDALRVARTTATIPAADRAARCREACDAFAALAHAGTFAETYLYAMWGHVAFGASDGGAVLACVEAHPASLDDAPFLVRPYLEELAARGRFDRLAKVATDRARPALAAWLLATHGRPFRALAMRGLAPLNDYEALSGEALALFLAGRPDLAEAALGERPLVTGDEEWLLAHRPVTAESRALRAWRGGLLGETGLLAEIRGAPEAADPDFFDMDLLARFEKALRVDLEGASVCVVGHFPEAGRLRAELAEKGARVVSGPFVGTDFFVAAPDADPKTVARLTGMGARRLPYPFVKSA